MPYYLLDNSGRRIGEFSCPQPFETVYSAENLPLYEDYRAVRARQYPPLGDFADAFYWMQQGDHSKMNAYLDACAAVKTQYPAPHGNEEDNA